MGQPLLIKLVLPFNLHMFDSHYEDVLTWMFCGAGGHHERLSAQECGGDV